MPTESNYTVQLKIIPNEKSSRPGEQPQRQIHRIHYGTLDEALRKLHGLPQPYFNAQAVKSNYLEGLVQHAAITIGPEHRPAIQLLNFFTPTDKTLKHFEKAPGPVLYFLKEDLIKEFSPAMRAELSANFPSLSTDHFISAADSSRALPAMVPGQSFSSLSGQSEKLYDLPGYFYTHETSRRLFGDLVPPGEPIGVTVKDITPFNDLKKAITDMLLMDIDTADPLVAHNRRKDVFQMSSAVKELSDDRNIVRLVSVRYEGVVPEMADPGIYIEFASKMHRRLAEAVMPELKKLGMPSDALATPIAHYGIDRQMQAIPTKGFTELRKHLAPSQELIPYSRRQPRQIAIIAPKERMGL